MMLPVRNGQNHVESLPDGRDVYINGERVADVTEHKAFHNSVRSAARLYDFQASPKNIEAMTFASPDGGRRVSRCWQLPKDYAEMVERRRALEAWAELHFGFMGRSPDHVASCVILYMGLDLFESYDGKRAAAVRAYYRFARDNDLLTYVIINPQADRSKAAHAQADPFLAAGVVDCMVRLPGAPAGCVEQRRGRDWCGYRGRRGRVRSQRRMIGALARIGPRASARRPTDCRPSSY
jgi:4-hydroxyphenylacetate 3-monooxygenase